MSNSNVGVITGVSSGIGGTTAIKFSTQGSLGGRSSSENLAWAGKEAVCSHQHRLLGEDARHRALP